MQRLRVTYNRKPTWLRCLCKNPTDAEKQQYDIFKIWKVNTPNWEKWHFAGETERDISRKQELSGLNHHQTSSVRTSDGNPTISVKWPLATVMKTHASPKFTSGADTQERKRIKLIMAKATTSTKINKDREKETENK